MGALLQTIISFRTGADEPTPYLYTVTRTASGPYVDGQATTGMATTFQITAMITPTTGRDLKILEEAGITTESKRVRTATPLQTRSPDYEPDVITIRGESWVVQNVATTETPDEVLYRAIVCRASMQ